VRRELKWAWGWEKHHQLSIAPVHFSVGFYFHALCFAAMLFDGDCRSQATPNEAVL